MATSGYRSMKSPSPAMAVIASEDNRFATHNGFDFIEIRKAMKENENANGNAVQAPSASRQRRMYFCGAILMAPQGL